MDSNGLIIIPAFNDYRWCEYIISTLYYSYFGHVLHFHRKCLYTLKALLKNDSHEWLCLYQKLCLLCYFLIVKMWENINQRERQYLNVFLVAENC